MPENIDNSLDTILHAQIPVLTHSKASNQRDHIPADPRAKRIQWSVTDSLGIISMPGDFSALGFADSEDLNEDSDLAIKQLQVFKMLGDAQTQELFAQFKQGIELGKNPPRTELKLSSGNGVYWVEQETIIQQCANGQPQVFSFWHDITRLKLVESKAQVLTQVIDAIPSWIFVKNTNHQYELVNSSYAAIYDASPEECLGKNSVELGVPEEIAKGNPDKGIRGFWADDREVFESGEPKNIMCEPIVVAGEQRFLQTRKTPIKNSETGQELLVGFCHDITYLKEIEERIGIELRLNKTLNTVDHLLREVDDPYQGLDKIQQVLSETVCCNDVKVQLSDSDCAEQTPNPDVDLFSTAIMFDGIKIACLDVWHDRSKPLSADDESLLLAVSGKLATAFHRQDLLSQINHQANYDSLSNLPNRHNILVQIDQAIETSKQNDQRCAVAILDLDGFKAINDTFGHLVGDELLLAVADRLKGISHPTETLARLGGDEFAILLTDLRSQEYGRQRAEKYLTALQDMFEVDGREVSVSGSLGISYFPEDSNNRDSIIQHADWAMYNAKSKGRNRCQPFTSKIAKETQHKISLGNDLQIAIQKERELYMEYQPKLDLVSKRVVGVEALVRWAHPEHGFVSPVEFIPIAKETGLITQLGQWIMRESCKTVALWNQQLNQKVQLSLNITPTELEQRGLTRQIIQTLVETGLEPDFLDLELTETFVMKRFDEASRRMEDLRRLGISISIDDFGSGYSCMSYLHKLPVDCLKIDRSFIELLDFDFRKQDSQRTSITQTIVTLAKSMGLQTVAEGIESENQYQHLLNLGVDVGQGYLFSRSLSGAKAFEFLCEKNQES